MDSFILEAQESSLWESSLYPPHFIVSSGETVYSVTSQCLSPPWSVIGYKEIFSEVWWNAGGDRVIHTPEGGGGNP